MSNIKERKVTPPDIQRAGLKIEHFLTVNGYINELPPVAELRGILLIKKIINVGLYLK